MLTSGVVPVNLALSLYDAIDNNDVTFVKRLVDVHKINLNLKLQQVRKRIHSDLCPAHLVAYRGHLELLRYLIEAGIDIKVTTSALQRQPIHYSALTHQLPCLKLLILSGCNIDARDTFGNTALHYAAEDGSNVMMTLIHNNASINAQDITNKTPLMKATRNGKINAVIRLIAAGSSVNLKDKNDDTALHFTARYGSIEMTNVLLKAGAKIDAQNQWGLTALMEAISYNQKDVVSLLVRSHCDLFKRDFRTGDTALHLAVKKNYYDIAQTLLLAGKWYIEYNFNSFGESFVHDAVVYNRPSLIRLFITYNCNFDYPAKKLTGVCEKTPFQLAIERCHWDMARLLSQVGCYSCKLNQSVQKKYHDLEGVKSLKSWCRKVLRRQLGFCACEKIEKLISLPPRLKNYLLFKDELESHSKQFN